MKYATLNTQQKVLLRHEVTERRSRRENITCRALAAWCKEKFKLSCAPGKSTVARVIKEIHDSLQAPVGVSKSVRARRGANPKLEAALYSWVCDQANLRRMINGPLIVAKAHRLQQLCNDRLSPEQRIDMNFSDGWLTRFKRRWGLSSFKIHGESGDADGSIIDEALPVLKAKLSYYAHCDIYNADECGLFYKMAPDRTVSAHRPQGRKKSKDRITVLVCANADGSDKFELMFIGSSLQPRAFKKRSGKDYGLDYYANKKAWMTGDLFNMWLHRFDVYITSQRRNVVLLIDNCGAHGRESTTPTLQSVEVVFLPPNTTSRLQPCDAGIIAAMKIRYRTFQMERALDLSEEEVVSDIYKVDILSAMLALKRIWTALPPSGIFNCWVHTGLVTSLSTQSVQINFSTEAPEALTSTISTLVPTHSRMDISEILNPEGENDCIQEANDSNLTDFVVPVPQESEECAVEEDDVLPIPSFREQLHAIALCKRLCDAYDVPDSARGTLSALQGAIRSERSQMARQTTLDEFMK